VPGWQRCGACAPRRIGSAVVHGTSTDEAGGCNPARAVGGGLGAGSVRGLYPLARHEVPAGGPPTQPQPHSGVHARLGPSRCPLYGLRRAFDAACRLAGLGPNIRLESRSPHTLLVLAEAGHGVAIIASTFRTHRYDLKIVRLTYGGRPLREPLAVLWDKRRPLPRFATAFCQMWAEHVRQVFPITRPTEPSPDLRAKQVRARGARG
jgi:DNA-binding transcriptional LysR family regulator